ncbi:hypothetical protein Q5752_003402 [Cryptotrichosporon argae]
MHFAHWQLVHTTTQAFHCGERAAWSTLAKMLADSVPDARKDEILKALKTFDSVRSTRIVPAVGDDTELSLTVKAIVNDAMENDKGLEGLLWLSGYLDQSPDSEFS